MEEYSETYSETPFNLSQTLSPSLKFLVVEDDTTQWPLWEHVLTSIYPMARIDWASHEADAEGLLRHSIQNDAPYQLVISDIFLKDQDTGLDLWDRYGEAAQNFVMVSNMTPLQFGALAESTLKINVLSPTYLQKPLSVSTCKQLVKALDIQLVK